MGTRKSRDQRQMGLEALWDAPEPEVRPGKPPEKEGLAAVIPLFTARPPAGGSPGPLFEVLARGVGEDGLPSADGASARGETSRPSPPSRDGVSGSTVDPGPLPPPGVPRTAELTASRPSSRVGLPAGAVMAREEALRLARNVAFFAGAGAGKTHSLVTICLHVLGGAREDRAPVRPSSLGLITFTEKAAAELKVRLRDRLVGLAAGTAEEPELVESFSLAGKPMPPAAFWRGVLDELGGATIGTFHSLCTQLLRSAPPGGPVPSAFTLLDERQARQLTRDVVERVLLQRLEARVPEAETLVTELSFTAVVDGLVSVFGQIREEGLSAGDVQVADVDALRARFEQVRDQVAALVDQGLAGRTKYAERLAELSPLLRGLTVDTLESRLEALQAVSSKIRSEPFPSIRKLLASRVDREEDVETLPLLWGAVLTAPLEAEVKQLLAQIEKAHRARLRELQVLDFTALLVLGRDLLRDDLEARAQAQERLEVLLVDEFQDTNRLQLELVLLLAEARGGPRRRIVAERRHEQILALPLEPGSLAVVGDRKQAIYEFRGADVSVFEAMAGCIERGGGGRTFLTTSRRAAPRLLQALNAGLARLMGAERYPGTPRDFQIVYRPQEDDLVPFREGGHPLPLVQLGLPQGADRPQDPDAVARYLATVLSAADVTVPDAASGERRQLKGKDVAVLFQRFTQLEAYRLALVRAGVPHRVVRGRGFWGAQEVVDLACALAVVADPTDARALAAVLRSPLVGLSDTSLVELAAPAGERVRWGLEAHEVLGGTSFPPSSSAEERARLARFRAVWREVSSGWQHAGVKEVLTGLIEGTAYRISLAAAPFGEQGLANVDKLLDFVSARHREGASVAAVAQELLELADTEPTEAHADVVDATDADAVTLCTVHQAKGLEWPWVVLPDLSAVAQGVSGVVRFDRAAGLAARPVDRDLSEVDSTSFRRVTAMKTARAEAERLRLLYVALTRARERVVFGLVPDRPRKGTWAHEVQQLTAWADVGAMVEPVDVSTLEPRAGAGFRTVEMTGRAVLEAAARRAEAPLARSEARTLLSVAELVDFSVCARRRALAHQVGLEEQGVGGEPGGRERGIAVHRLLELAPLDQHGAELYRSLEELRRAEGLSADLDDEALSWVKRFLDGPGAALMAGEVARELPFMVEVEGGVLTGQIDAVVEQGDEVVVLDYKTSREDAPGWPVQLSCYALAARRLYPGRTVRAAVVPLREVDPAPRFIELEAGEALDTRVGALFRHAARALDGPEPEVLPVERCRAAGCGYSFYCHMV